MLKTTLKDLWAKKIRLVTTSVAVLLGVAFMSGTLVLTDTIGRTFNDLFDTANPHTDAVIRSSKTIDSGGPGGEARPHVDVAIVEAIRAVPGVRLARPSIFKDGVQIVGRNGKALGGGLSAPTFGGSWTDDELDEYKLAEGRAPSGTGEVVMDRGSATKAELGIGDTTTILTPDVVKVKIVGIVTFGSADSALGATFVGMDEAAAEHVFAEPGRADSIVVGGDGSVSQTELKQRISAALPKDLEVLTGEESTKENEDDIQQGLGFFKNILLAFAYIALFVGSFIIYNTFGIIIAQRTRELALLRALGASRRQVLVSVLVEATIVGAVAGLLGMGLGILLASGLKALLDVLGLDVPAGSIVVTQGTVIASVLTGTVVSVTSAFFPARRASKVPPLAAMRDVAFENTRPTRRRVIGGLVVTGIGVLSLLNGVFAKGSGALSKVGLGALLTFIGVAILGPVLASPVARFLGAPLPRLRGVTGGLSRENALRNPKRTASTAAALMIGVALIGFISVTASSASKSITKLVDERFKSDLIVDGGGFNGSGFSPKLAADIRTAPEVDAVAAVQIAPVVIDGHPVAMFGVDVDTMDRVYDVVVKEGDLPSIGDDGIGVQADYAKSNGLKLGSTVPIRFVETGEVPFTVRAIYQDKTLAGNYFMGTGAFAKYVKDPLGVFMFVALRDGVTVEAGKAAVEKIAKPYPTAKIEDVSGFRESRQQMFNVLLALVYGLLLLAIVIALIGIANTLALSVFERTREIGLLRAVGMSRRQLRSMIRWESVLIALVGTTLGLGIGLFFGWAMSKALRSEGFTEFSVPIAQLIFITIVAGFAGVLAAWWPARRAAKLNILAAIDAEG